MYKIYLILLSICDLTKNIIHNIVKYIFPWAKIIIILLDTSYSIN